MEYKSRQEIFNTVKDHLLKQGVKSACTSKNPNSGEDITTCMYRGPDGAKCAAGVLIPDEAYKTSFEGYAVTYSVIHEVLQTNGVNMDIDDAFVRALQKIHDEHKPATWAERLTEFASSRGLQP